MKSNQVSILVVLVLCLAMGGFLYIMDRSSDEAMGWNPSEMYGELGARSYEGSSYSNVTFSGGAASDGVAVSMRNGSFSLRARSSRASMPVATPQASSPSLSGSTSTSSSGSLIGHMTSSAEYHSFGGGHSGNMGSAMTGMTNSGNVAASFAYSSPSYGVANTGLSSYSPITLSSGTDGTQVMSAEQALISTSSTASGLFGSALQNTYGTASYDQTVYGSNGSTPNGVRGKQNAPSSGLGNGWWNWLNNWVKDNGEDYIVEHDGNKYYLIDRDQLYAAWYDFVENYWNSGMGEPPTFDEWWEWYSSTMYGGKYDEFGENGSYYQYGNYLFTPVGDILPLFMLAFLYLVCVFVRRRKSLAKQA